MKKLVLILLIILNKSVSLYAQKDSIVPSIKTYNVGIFAPLYLDSVFNGINYKYTRSFPKFVLPGLDFVQGAQVALDSMDKIYGNINAAFYDSKSPSQNIPSLIRNRTLDSLDIIIGSVRDSDYVYLSQFALQKNIPFISATYPNDAGITANPFVVIVNSTLKAHCEAIYSYILQSHGSDKIFLVRKPGPQEDRIAAYFKNINEPDGKPLLNIQMVSINESFLPLENKLDSVKENIIIGGSLDEKFAARLVASSFTYSKNNAVKVIGMPNWDGFALGKKNALQDFPIYF
ncbi:MAG: hypothetical protein ABIP80_03835, partial [Ferruginibacter sp.]